MTTDRRRLLRLGAAAAVGAATVPLLPPMPPAGAAESGVQLSGAYRRRLGDFEVTALLDGYLDIANELWHGIDQAKLEALIEAAFLPGSDRIRIGITSYLVDTGSRLVLIDSGSRDLFGPTAGRFASSLGAAGHAPGDVDAVLVTHMHPDHVAALLTAARTAVFPNAVVHICASEITYWTDAAEQARAPDFAKPWFTLASEVAAAYGERVTLFSGTKEVEPGFTGLPLIGHTPGHTGYQITSGNEALLVWGDACGVAAVQFAHPDAGLVFDVDGATGAATRRTMLEMAAAERLLVAGAHLPFPSFGHVARSGTAYRWAPDDWQFEF